MKKTFTLIIVCLFAGAFNTHAQCIGDRYKMQLFNAISISSDILYGTNINYNGSNQDLLMDIYEPVGDTATNRPIVIIAHGGSFLIGSKTGPDVVPLAESLAKMGYVVASINYRLGFEGIIGSTLDSIYATETVIRAVHDFRAAIRFLKKDFSENGNAYGIDTSLIFGGGISSGAITALQVGYMNNLNEVPSYVDTSKLGLGGGIEGNSGTPGYSSIGLAGIVNISGALKDTNWISTPDIPILSLHGNLDETVPYNTDTISLLGSYPIIEVDGSASIHIRSENNGLINCLYTYFGQDHAPHVGSDFYTDTTLTLIRNFLSSIICEENMICEYNGTTEYIGIANSNSFEVNIYPIPAYGYITLESNIAINEIRLFDYLGKNIFSRSINNKTIQVNRNNLPAGIYMLTIETYNGKLTKKVSFE